MSVLGVALLVLAENLEVLVAEIIPGHKLIPVPGDGRHDDDREDAGHEQDQPGAIAVLRHASIVVPRGDAGRRKSPAAVVIGSPTLVDEREW